MKPDLGKDNLAGFLTGVAVILSVTGLYLLYTAPVTGEPSIEQIPDMKIDANSSVDASFGASNVQELHYTVTTIDGNQTIAPLSLQLESNPSPRSVTQTLPPYWHWDPTARELSGRFTVGAWDAAPGAYNVTVTVWNHGEEHVHSGGDSVSFTVEVTED